MTASFVLAAVAAAAMLSPRLAQAAPDPCAPDPLEGNRVICNGDQAAGIASGIDFNSAALPGPFNTLDVTQSPTIAPAAGIDGVVFSRTAAGDVTVNASVWITPTGVNARGIVAESEGTPPPAPIDPFLGIPIPGTAAVAGGVVEVNYFGIISTSDDGGDGIVATSRTSGYPAAVTTALENFDPTVFSFNLLSAVDPAGGPPILPTLQGSNGENILVVPGTLYELVDTNGDGVLEEREVVGGDGGSFWLFEDGRFFHGGGVQAPNRFARVQYLTEGTRAGGPTEQAYGSLDLSLDPATLGTWQTAFADTATGDPKWGRRDDNDTGSLDIGASLPDMNAYTADLLEQAAAGGDGNSVSVNSTGWIQTRGEAARAIVAESVGAKGADGRDAYTGFLVDGHSSTRGAPGKAGGAVNIGAVGLIATEGDESIAVLAASTGGNGGQGGDSSTGRNSKAGGAGGNGGTVTLRNDPSGAAEGITTQGDNATGILAISRGGNGGGGGAGATFNSAEDGGPGGSGGSIDIRGAWTITTSGDEAYGIWGKSVGGVAGGGGDGGWTGTSAGDGGQATGGGDVAIESDGNIKTTGMDAFGIYAQSIGGFGGDGGDTSSVFVAYGGSGKSAGPGGDILVTNRGRITTGVAGAPDLGKRSHAIFAQSVGGGGGSGGDGGALAGYGGGSAAGGHGGDVNVLNAATGIIETYGNYARGIYAQSIGGGGGDGGDGAGVAGIGGRGSGTSAGGRVTVINDGSIVTHGERANAIFAESVGGGGGDGGDSSGLISIGGSGGGGGDADIVTVDNNNLLMTSGSDASAIFAQSVGGGGGNGGSSQSFGLGASVAIGGDGAAGGNAGQEVRIGNLGAISTLGDRSHGVFAQSVGGGGGNGGYAIAAAVGESASFSAVIGGKGGGGGLGKLVNVSSSGEITTDGKDAHGIVAQSVGGGGGAGGFAISASAGGGFAGSMAIGGAGGTGNKGGTVIVRNTGRIATGVNDPALVSIDQLEGIDADIQQLLGAQFATIGDLYDATTADIAAIAGIDGFSAAPVEELLDLGIAQETIDKLNQATAEAMAPTAEEGQRDSYSRVLDLSQLSVEDLTTISIEQAEFCYPSGFGFSCTRFPPVVIDIGEAAATELVAQIGRYVQTIPETLQNQAISQLQVAEHSYGILAQSVGGGGGDGGFSVAGSMSGGASAAFSMGGDGAPGGDGGSVDLENAADISTRGNDAHAIVAQSVGGGGGSGGFSVAGSLSGGGAAAASVGGAGAGGGDGGAVRAGTDSLVLFGNITTSGDHAYGLLAQSVGGG
ncbi:MAG: hypothetical protein ACR2QV_10605, partial [Gammaproteobacteria bacterium]